VTGGAYLAACGVGHLVMAKSSQAKPSQAKLCQAEVLTGGGDLRFAQVDVPLSVSHSCV